MAGRGVSPAPDDMSAEQPNGSDSRPLAERMQAYGCTHLIRLDEPLSRPEQIEYLDLLPRRRSSPCLDAVAEHQGAALLYVLDGCGDTQTIPADVGRFQRQLANRSDPAWLGVVRQGSLELHPVGFHEEAAAAPIVTLRKQDPQAPFFFQSLVHGSFPLNDQLHGSDYVFEKIHELLDQTVQEYVETGSRAEDERSKPLIPALDVLSMAGRALFFRFLIDRRIVLEAESRDICPAADSLRDAFANAEKAAQTSAWLDETFNGDFLQLFDETIPADRRTARERAYRRYYRRIGRRAGNRFFDHLHAILNGWRAVGGGGFQLPLDWKDLDFAHIPVGVLSQVYESFSHRADHRAAKDTSVHYTPRNIARLLVDQTFAAVEDPAQAKVLDPTCGAGIFLVLAFRRLVSERWQRDGERPKTKAIQEILYQQLRGFDVSEPALRLAALALYITAIEVDGKQRPPKALKFPRNLRDTVLHRFGGSTRREFVLGSLGPDVPAEHDGTFDVVIGNPPWTRLREQQPQSTGERRAKKAATDELNKEFTKIGRRALRNRGLSDMANAYKNPDKNPDIPFVWRATEWAKPDDGIISFALPARIFGHTTDSRRKTWRAILRGLSVTGLINGADLRWSNVWKGVKAPFCLFFARNAIPARDHRFYYAAPANEPDQNEQARFRIDYDATRPVSVERVERQPWVLKTLALGTWRDVAIMEQLLAPPAETLESRWTSWNPKLDKTGQGYNRSPALRQELAKFLGSLQDFEPPPDGGFPIDYGSLKTYLEKYGHQGSSKDGCATAHKPRTEALYQPPLVIIPQSPGDNPRSPKAFLSSRAIAYSQSYYGYSCKDHAEAKTLAALIYLLVHSEFFRYFVLMTSASQGSDRMRFIKADLDGFPFPDVSTLSEAEKATIRELTRRLENSAEKPWSEIDAFIFNLYQLDDSDARTVRDTLFAAAAYRRQGRAALERTTRAYREPFLVELRDMLDPYFDVCGEIICVEEPSGQPDTWHQPWFFLAISRADEPVEVNADLLCKAMEEANKLSASRIIVRVPRRRGVLLGLLNQKRWWTVTRARLCAQHVIRHHLDAFGLAEAA